MKFSNFRALPPAGDGTKYALVDMTTGALFWKRTREVQVFKGLYSAYWRFLGSGTFVPGYEVEDLEIAYRAQQKMPKVDA